MFLKCNELEQLEFKLEKLLGLRNMQEKLENDFFSNCVAFLHTISKLYDICPIVITRHA